MIVTQFTAYLHTAIQSIYRLHTLHAAISVNVLSTTAGNIDVPTHHTSADTVESASNPAYPTSNPNEVAGDPAYPTTAYPEQLGYPPAYPHQTAGAYPSVTQLCILLLTLSSPWPTLPTQFSQWGLNRLQLSR